MTKEPAHLGRVWLVCPVILPRLLGKDRLANVGEQFLLAHVGMDNAENESCSPANQTRADLLG